MTIDLSYSGLFYLPWHPQAIHCAVPGVNSPDDEYYTINISGKERSVERKSLHPLPKPTPSQAKKANKANEANKAGKANKANKANKAGKEAPKQSTSARPAATSKPATTLKSASTTKAAIRPAPTPRVDRTTDSSDEEDLKRQRVEIEKELAIAVSRGFAEGKAEAAKREAEAAKVKAKEEERQAKRLKGMEQQLQAKELESINLRRTNAHLEAAAVPYLECPPWLGLAFS